MVENTASTANIFLTIYPINGLDSVSTQDWTDLGNQILGYQTTLNRSVFLRYAPEFNGSVLYSLLLLLAELS